MLLSTAYKFPNLSSLITTLEVFEVSVRVKLPSFIWHPGTSVNLPPARRVLAGLNCARLKYKWFH